MFKYTAPLNTRSYIKSDINSSLELDKRFNDRPNNEVSTNIINNNLSDYNNGINRNLQSHVSKQDSNKKSNKTSLNDLKKSLTALPPISIQLPISEHKQDLLSKGWPLHAFDNPAEVLSGIWISGIAFDEDLPRWCSDNRFTHIVNAAGSYGRVFYYRTHPNEYDIQYLELDIDDQPGVELGPHLDKIYNFMCNALVNEPKTRLPDNSSKCSKNNLDVKVEPIIQLSGSGLGLCPENLASSSGINIPQSSKPRDIRRLSFGKQGLSPNYLGVSYIPELSGGFSRSLDNDANINKPVANKILVHCMWGQSRSAACILYFLMRQWKIKYDAALSLVRKARPCVAPNSGFDVQLRAMNFSLPDNKTGFTLSTKFM
ncbi:Dual specificity protein phosphatase [uncultured virus]|nr:Dual specificity protein phosphatase [uncultured virus]